MCETLNAMQFEKNLQISNLKHEKHRYKILVSNPFQSSPLRLIAQ